jgi:hypothetical protein
MSALVAGRTPDNGATPRQQMQVAFMAAAAHDPEVARAWLDTFLCLASPHEVMARPGLAQKVVSFAGAPVPQVSAPTRGELLALVQG